MNTLTIDDELVSREKMKKIMSSFGTCVAVDNGPAGVSAFRDALKSEAPFDLLTLDISMPEMDGTEVLMEIRNIEKEFTLSKEKQVKVMVVTAQADKDTVITCVQAGCDGYIVKPFDRGVMTHKLEEIGFSVAQGKEDQGTVRKLVMETVQNVRKGNINLPVLPHVVKEIQEVMNKPTSTTNDLARVIEKDAVITVKLISTANSPLYRGTEKIHTVQAAIPRLGLKESQNIVSAIANKSLYKTKNKQAKGLMERLWLHSLACAYCAKAISQKVGYGDTGKIFLMGLLHDIGKVLLLQSLNGTAYQNELFNREELIDSIQEVHTSFGAALLDQWGFSQDFIKVATFHEWMKYRPETEKEILIINLGNNLARKIGYSFFDNDEIDLARLESVKLLDIQEEVLHKIGDDIKVGIQDSADIF
jgi:putative nucleotidyltransferase with HDIG domain